MSWQTSWWFSLLLAMSVASPLPVRAQQAADSSLPLGMSKTRPERGPSVETAEGFMIPYSQRIPGTEVSFTLIPIPGGTFLLGSPAEESGRDDDEGPQVEVHVEPLWVAKYEVSWAEYRQFMSLYSLFKEFQQLRNLAAMQGGSLPSLHSLSVLQSQLALDTVGLDAVTCPTPLYSPEVTFESGDALNLPAVTMTPFAARQYTKWISRTTGFAYRLPTGEEWEHAARAGSTTPYPYGSDPEQLADYAWFEDNADDRTHPVGTKLPNAWGLHNMLGNVSELVLNRYRPDGYQQIAQEATSSASSDVPLSGTQSRSVRGGNWLLGPEECRSASRFGTEDEDWKVSDPSLPLSPWWYTETFPAGGVGFRVVRQLSPIAEEQREACWGADSEEIRETVQARLREGRGASEQVTRSFPQAAEQLRSETTQALLRYDED